MPTPSGEATLEEIQAAMRKASEAATVPAATPKAEAPVAPPKAAPTPKPAPKPKADWDSIPTPKPHGFEQEPVRPQDFGRPPRKGEAAFKDENGQWHVADASVPGAPEPVFNPDDTRLPDTTTPSGETYQYSGSPASAYAQRLYETVRRGKESQQKLESGASWDAYRQVLLGNKEEPEGFGNFPGAGQVFRYINNQFDTDAERAAAGREALDVAQSLTIENVAGINDPEAVYNLVAQEYGGDAKANIATGRAYHKLMSYYLQKHVRPESTTAQRVALANQAKDWAAKTLKGLRYFGELPVDLEVLRQTPEFETRWEDLIPGVEDLKNPSAWNERLQRFGREYATAFKPKGEILPGGTVVEGEGPVDWFFRMEFGTLGAKVTAAEAMLPSSWGGEGRVPQPYELLKGLYHGKSALTEVVENPYLIEQLSSDDPEEQIKGWATLLLAGGIDLTSDTTSMELSAALQAPRNLRLLRKMSQEYTAAVEAERLANPNRRLASIAREVAERNLRPTTASGEALALGTKVEDVRIPLVEKSKEAIKAEDVARAEAARVAKAEEKTAALERTQTPEDAYRTVEEERPPKGMDDEYLNRVTENMKRDEDVAIFLRRRSIYQDPIRRLEGTKMLPRETDRIKYELAGVTKEVEPKVAELEADRAAFKTWMKDARERITNGAFTEGDFAKEHALLRDRLKAKLEALKPLLREQVKLQRELKGAERYEELYAKASDFERQRLVKAVKSNKPLPSYFEGKKPPETFAARSPVDLPVEGGPPSAKATESILKPSPENLLETKGRGLATREQRANVAKRLLDEAGIPMDPNVKDPLVQLERILHTSPAKVRERITELEEQASELRKANPWLMDLQNTDSATVENVQAQVNALLNPDATAEERAQAEHLVLLLGMTHPKWQELLPQVAVWQREMRYGNASTWSFALTGEYYSTPGGLLKGFKNEILEPRQADAIWARYVDRQRYAIRRHLADSPDFALFCGFDAGDLPKVGDDLWAGMAKTSKGTMPAPSVNSWFRSKLIEFGASESGLSKEHILTNDLVWVGDAKASGAFAKAVPDAWVPGSIHLEEGMKTTVIHARSFKPAEERIRPGITAITKENKKWYGGVPVTPKTGFLAKVREVNADGTITVEALQFEREGSPRHVATGFVTKTKAQHLDYFERGRVQYQRIAEESGVERTEARAMTQMELRKNKGSEGVKYIGPQVERFQPFAPPVQYTRENFEWSPADLGNISFEDYKRLQEKGRLRDSTPGRIPQPKLLPDVKTPTLRLRRVSVQEASASDGARYFSVEALQKAENRVAASKGKKVLALMHPADFLSLALPGLYSDTQKEKDALLRAGGTFQDIPTLRLNTEDVEKSSGALFVDEHDGRHRARALLKNNVTEMPVILDRDEPWTEVESRLVFPELHGTYEDFREVRGLPRSGPSRKPRSGYLMPDLKAKAPSIRRVSAEEFRASDGAKYFEPALLKKAAEDASRGGRYGVALVDPSEFLRLAPEGLHETKLKRVGDVASENKPFNTLPFLEFRGSSEEGFRVSEHNGRHRAEVLRQKGVREMPVVVENYREPWNENVSSVRIHPQDLEDAPWKGVRSGQLMPTSPLEAGPDFIENLMVELQRPTSISEGAGREGIELTLAHALEQGVISEEVHDASLFFLDQLPAAITHDTALAFVEDLAGRGASVPAEEEGKLLHLIAIKKPTNKDAGDLILTLSHEYGHAIHERLPDELRQEVSEAYKAAKAKGATKRKGFMPFFNKYKTEDVAESEWFAWQFSEYMSHDVIPAAAKMEPSGKLVQVFDRVKKEISAFVQKVFNFGPWKTADATVQRITEDVLEGRVELKTLLAEAKTEVRTVENTEDVARPVKATRTHAEVVASKDQELASKIVAQRAEAERLKRAQANLKDSWDVLSEELRQTADELKVYEDETKARLGAAFTEGAPGAVGFEARTPMEVKVNEHLRAELDKVAQPELAYPTVTLVQHMAEGLAAKAHQEGDTTKTADHFLEALLDTSLTAKGDGEYNPFLLTEKLGYDADSVQAAVATLDLTHIQDRYKVPFEKLQAWAKELPAGSPDPAQVEEVQKLLYSGVKNEQVSPGNIPANYGEWVPRVGRVKGEKSGVELLKSVQNRLVMHERKATAGSIKNQVRQLVGTMRDWFNPSRDVMDRSLTPAVRNLLRDFDATNNKVSEDLNALMVELEREGDASKPGALVAKADHLYPNTSRSWNESFIGGTLNADALEEVSLAYVDREKFREAPQVKKELADLVKAHMARGEDLSTVREALLVRTRELVPEALADERLGDLVFVKNATLSAQHHEMLLELHGLGAVLGPEEQKLAAEWATGTSSASEGARLVAMGVDDPNAYRKALGGNFAPGGEDLNEAISKPFVQLATLSRDRKVQKFEDVSVAAGKPTVPWSVRQHVLAQILEGRSITRPDLVTKNIRDIPGTSPAGRSAFKKVLTTGMFIASPVFHLGNKFGDFVANVDRLGILGGLRVEAAVAFRELLAVPGVGNAKIIFKNFAGKFGEKADKAFDHFLTIGAYSQDVIALQRGEGELVLTDGRRYNNAGLLQIARRMAVNDTFQSSEIVRSANGYLARRHGFGGRVWRHLAEQYDQTTQVAQQISEARRYGLFIELIKSGKEPMEAARVATETLIDYKHNLHPIDRSFFVDMVYPFWNFIKGNNRRFTRLMMNPDLWYAPARTNRAIDTVTEIASQAFDSRDQWQFNVDDMPPDVKARYDKLAALWKSKGLQRYSLASLMYAANEEMMLNPEGDVSARNTPAMQFLAEAREVYGPDFDGFLQQYYMPDPSRWGMPDLLADRNVVWTPDAQKSSMNVWTNGKDTTASDGTWNAIVSPANPDVDAMTFQYRVARTAWDLSYLLKSWFIQPISLGLLNDEGPEDVRIQGMKDNLMKLTGNATSRSPLAAGGALWFSQIDPRDIGLNGTPISEDVARNLPSSAYTVTVETHGDPDSPDGAVQVKVYRLLPHFENAALLSTLITGLPVSTGTNWMGKVPGRSSFTPDEQRELVKYFFGISTVHADPASRVNQMEAQAADRLMSVQGGKKPTVPMMDSATSRLSQRQSAEAFLLQAPEALRPVLLQRAEEKIRSLPSFNGEIVSDTMALRLVGLGRVILLQQGVPEDQVDGMSPEQVLSAVRRQK